MSEVAGHSLVGMSRRARPALISLSADGQTWEAIPVPPPGPDRPTLATGPAGVGDLIIWTYETSGGSAAVWIAKITG